MLGPFRSLFKRAALAAGGLLVLTLALFVNSCGSAVDAGTAPIIATALAVTAAPSASPQDRIAFPTQPSVQLEDVNGNAAPLAGTVITASITAGGGTLNGSATATTSSTGAATFTNLSVAGTVGVRTLTFSASGLTSATATLTLVPGAATTIAVGAGNTQAGIAGAAVTTAPAVAVTDADGNVVSGTAVTFAVASGNGSLTGASQTTNTSGTATVGSWTLGTTAGTNTLTATSPGLSGSPLTFTVTATAGPATKLVVTASPSSTAVDRVAIVAQPGVQLQDANGNASLTAGTVITASISAGGGTLGGATTASTASDGAATFTNLSIAGTVGPRTLSFGASGLSSATAAVTVIPGVAAAIGVNAGNAQTGVAGAALATAPAVQVNDADGNGVSGVAVTFAIATGGGSISGGSATTSASGIAAAGSWTLGTTPGTNTLTATATGLAGSPLTFTAAGTAGAAAQLVVATAPTASPQSRLAFATQPALQLQDANGNPVAQAGTVVTAAISAGSGSIGGTTTATTTSTGAATFSDLSIAGTIGARTLTFSAAGFTSTTAGVTLIAGAAATVAVNAGNNQSAIAGDAVTAAPSVIVVDADGNTVSAVAVTFAATAGGGSITGGSATTNASGIAAVGSWTLGTTAGTNTLSATAAGLTGSPVTFTASGAPVVPTTMSVVSGSSQTAFVGTTALTQPTVIVKDQRGLAMAGARVTFSVANGAGAVTGGSQVTNAQGIATVGSWTLGSSPGSNTLTVTADGLTGAPVTITATAAAAVIVVQTNSDIVNGSIADPNALVASPGADGISLREALIAVDSVAVPFEITFAPALIGQTIAPQTPLPNITSNGTTIVGVPAGDGAPGVTLDGELLPTCCSVLGGAFATLQILASNVTVRGLRFIKANPGNRSIQVLVGVYSVLPLQLTDLVIEDNIFDATSSTENGQAIHISGSPEPFGPAPVGAHIARVLIRNNQFLHFQGEGDAVIVGGGLTSSTIENVNIEDNVFVACTLAIEIYNAGSFPNVVIRYTTIRGNSFVDGVGQTITIWQDSPLPQAGNSIDSTVIAGNRFTGGSSPTALLPYGAIEAVVSGAAGNTVSRTWFINNVFASGCQGVNADGGGAGPVGNGSVTGFHVVNNTFYRMTCSGVHTGNSVNYLEIRNNIFWTPGGNGSTDFLNAFNVILPDVSFNILLNGYTGSNGNFNADPLFVAADAGDFHLQNGSPAIHTGTPADAPTTDLACFPRTGVPDLGAYAYGSTGNRCATTSATTSAAFRRVVVPLRQSLPKPAVKPPRE